MVRHSDLEARLRAQPDDTDSWLVYADFLAQQGDPRGEVILLRHRLETEAPGGRERAMYERRYAERCRAARWPKEGPWPKMSYRLRFERMLQELGEHSAVQIETSVLGPPADPDEIARWKAVAGPAWPDGMEELYSEVGRVDLEYRIGEKVEGAIHLPPLSELWNYEGLQDELWHDFLEAEHPLHAVRPIDRFGFDGCAVLYPVPSERPAEVAYHDFSDQLVLTGLSYREWLELLFRSRGVAHWLLLTLDPRKPSRRTRVGKAFEMMNAFFPDFGPSSMRPPGARASVDLS